MKRIAISITIIALIFVAGYSAVALIDSGNDRLYGQLELVTDSYRSQSPDVEKTISELERSVADYSKRLGWVVSDELLGEMELSTARLMPMYQSNSDEFLAVCSEIKEYARLILESEKVTWSKIL